MKSDYNIAEKSSGKGKCLKLKTGVTDNLSYNNEKLLQKKKGLPNLLLFSPMAERSGTGPELPGEGSETTGPSHVQQITWLIHGLFLKIPSGFHNATNSITLEGSNIPSTPS
ncbi:hypothetical protein XENOCAPTIV_020442 [Xenoophorus captivus]|uniref:Uncharacterized protein n=1 Tax=Xenoophorus captivus TaxID=1517983 RepID=A0ABV0R9U9_9TELE